MRTNDVPSALRRAEAIPPAEKLAWSVHEAARVVGLSARTLQVAISRGELKRVKVGRRTLLRPEDVRAWIDSQVAG